MKIIVALIDFSELTGRVVDLSAEQAKAFGAELYLLHVEPGSGEKLYRHIDKAERDRIAQVLKTGHAELLAKATELRELGVDVKPMLLEGVEVDTILSTLAKLSPDLLIMGNHRHGGVYSFLVGSVGEEILKEIESPVLLVS